MEECQTQDRPRRCAQDGQTGRARSTRAGPHTLPTAARIPSAGEIPQGHRWARHPSAEQHSRDLRATWDANGARPEGVGIGKAGPDCQHRKPLAECSEDELWRGELDLELTELERLRDHQDQLHKKLKALAAEDERVQLLQTIPGVGRKTAEVVVAYIDDPHRFKNARQVSSYAGLVPRRYQSGEMDRHGRINKRGPRLLRGALVEAAWMMLRYNPWARSVYDRLCSRQKTRKKKAIVAVARKLLVRCWMMLLRKEPWNKEAGLPKPAAVA